MIIRSRVSISVLSLAVLLMGASGRSLAQDTETGWLEGTIADKLGKPLTGLSSTAGAMIRVIGPSKLEVRSDGAMGGFYTIRNLKPGVYEVFVENTGTTADPYRAVHVWGVLIKPGVRTTLKIVQKPGSELEEIGKPVIVSQPAIVISLALEHLQAEIDELRRK